ncbi:unnamed protein product [Blepharisma stoltei]|uniref:FAD-binding FR-type domain-containing protein n=1 Tax=Blepharisma stoltei TaxID=1481888 RepID=A0AAU9IL28_9CILI|nr:unnamed protein product [Blepharisma stoltei]
MKIVDYLSINTISYPENFLINKNNSDQNNMIWRMAKKRKISHRTYIITFKSKEFELNPVWEKAEWLGKHFKASIMVKSSLTNKYTTISRYYSCIFVDLDSWKQEVSDEGSEITELTRNDVKGLSFIIKVYKGGIMTEYLKSLAKNEKIALKGPLGPGLSVDNLSGEFIAVAGGTGLVPFLDLVHYIWVNRNNPHEFKLTLIVSFRRKKDVFAYDLISATERAVNSNIFKFVLIVSSKKQKPCLRELLIENGKQKPKKAWVCGPSGFNSFVAEVLMQSGLERQNIIIM